VQLKELLKYYNNVLDKFSKKSMNFQKLKTDEIIIKIQGRSRYFTKHSQYYLNSFVDRKRTK